jgi:chemotaxis protein MotB
MKIQHYLIAAILCTTLHSCVVLSPKKYKALVADRDSLQNRTVNLDANVSSLQGDTTRLHHEIADMKGQLASLNDRYNTLNGNYNTLNDNYNTTSSKVTKLSGDKYCTGSLS